MRFVLDKGIVRHFDPSNPFTLFKGGQSLLIQLAEEYYYRSHRVRYDQGGYDIHYLPIPPVEINEQGVIYEVLVQEDRRRREKVRATQVLLVVYERKLDFGEGESQLCIVSINGHTPVTLQALAMRRATSSRVITQ